MPHADKIYKVFLCSGLVKLRCYLLLPDAWQVAKMRDIQVRLKKWCNTVLLRHFYCHSGGVVYILNQTFVRQKGYISSTHKPTPKNQNWPKITHNSKINFDTSFGTHQQSLYKINTNKLSDNFQIISYYPTNHSKFLIK